MKRMKTYSELMTRPTFVDRFRYLRLSGEVGFTTLGYDRYLGQKFYASSEWRDIRMQVIVRDQGGDLGSPDQEVAGRVLIHHMNPIVVEDLRNFNLDILDPEYLITTCHATHNAIHYGDEALLPKPYVPRRPGDTTLW